MSIPLKHKDHPENQKLVLRLRELPSSEIDPIVHKIADEETRKTDCTSCGKCCSRLQPAVTDSDIAKLDQALPSSPEQIKADLLVLDTQSGVHYMKSCTCSLLEGKKCSVYQHRPASCADYTHQHHKHIK